MKLGNLKNIFFIIAFIIFNNQLAFADNKIKTVPLINLDELSPTFEEDEIKEELEKTEDDKNILLKNTKYSSKQPEPEKQDTVYINLTALDKITAKTSSIRLAVGDKKFFGPLEIKALKCQISDNSYTLDTVAYIQVKDLSTKDNNQVFLFNGWSFVSSPTLKSIDHPIYDLWITSCENI